MSFTLKGDSHGTILKLKRENNLAEKVFVAQNKA